MNLPQKQAADRRTQSNCEEQGNGDAGRKLHQAKISTDERKQGTDKQVTFNN
jgi:hypothetical protein